jgi:hypothetical protein
MIIPSILTLGKRPFHFPHLATNSHALSPITVKYFHEINLDNIWLQVWVDSSEQMAVVFAILPKVWG